jgi:hypothetical protein
VEAQTDPTALSGVPTAPPAADGAGPPAVLAYSSGKPQADDPDDYDRAVASLLCGMMVCAPFVTGILSPLFALTVLRHWRRMRTPALVIGVLGAVLGVLNLAFWTAAMAGAFGD